MKKLIFGYMFAVAFSCSLGIAAENELQSFKPLVSLLQESVGLERFFVKVANEIFEDVAPDNKNLKCYQREIDQFDNYKVIQKINKERSTYSGDELACRLNQIHQDLKATYCIKKKVISTILYKQLLENSKLWNKFFNNVRKIVEEVRSILESRMFDSPGELDFDFDYEDYISRSVKEYQKEINKMEEASVSSRTKMGLHMMGVNQKESKRKMIPYDTFFTFKE